MLAFDNSWPLDPEIIFVFSFFTTSYAFDEKMPKLRPGSEFHKLLRGIVEKAMQIEETSGKESRNPGFKFIEERFARPPPPPSGFRPF